MEVDLSAIVLLLIGGFIFLGVGFLISQFTIKRGLRSGRSLSDLKDEMEIRKSVFAVLGGVTVVAAIVFGANEFRLKSRAEDRELFYASLGQLSGNSELRSDIATAALLQLKNLGNYSQQERPTITRIVSAYLNETAKYPALYYENSNMARPDIQISMEILSELISENIALGALVNLRNIDLRNVQLANADFRGVRIMGSYFSGASITDSKFDQCNLTSSKLTEGSFAGTSFENCIMDFVDFSYSQIRNVSFCGNTSLTSVNVKQAIDLEKSQCPPTP